MQQPSSVLEVREKISRIKGAGSAFLTNFFLDDASILSCICQGKLSLLEEPGAAILLKREPLFDRVYFACSHISALAPALEHVPNPPTTCLISDVIGTADAASSIVDQFLSAGFRRFTEFRTMHRVNAHKVECESDAADVACEGEAQLVWDGIRTHFDPQCEHIPDMDDVLAAVSAGTVLVTRENGHPTAILWYDRQGASSILRYWLVLPHFRGRGLGESLMSRYFRDCDITGTRSLNRPTSSSKGRKPTYENSSKAAERDPARVRFQHVRQLHRRWHA
jgi:hypothetical protein